MKRIVVGLGMLIVLAGCDGNGGGGYSDSIDPGRAMLIQSLMQSNSAAAAANSAALSNAFPGPRRGFTCTGFGNMMTCN